MKNIFTVALLQIPPLTQNAEKQLELGLNSIRLASQMGAHLALFPELWKCGYPPAGSALSDPSILHASAVRVDSAWVDTFRQGCKQNHIGAGITYLEDHPTGLRNSVTLIAPDGNILCTYAKVHTCAFDWEGRLAPGDGFPVVDFPGPGGVPVKIGCLICMDREYPEAARVCMLNGAELLLIPNSCELEQHRLHQIEARAFENMVAIAVTNYPAPYENGHSIAFSPIAFDDEGSADMVVCEAGPDEGIYLAHFDLDAIRAYRAAEVWGPNYRHPHLYYKIAKR